MLWEPIRFLESCPSSDGACAVVLTDEAAGRRRPRTGACVDPRCLVALGPPSFPGRDQGSTGGRPPCAQDVYDQAGITNPREQIDMAELYVPFSWHEVVEARTASPIPVRRWKMIDNGDTEIGGSFPVNCSGGVLSSNHQRLRPAPLRRGRQPGAWSLGAGLIDGAKVALAAYGANSQYLSMWAEAQASTRSAEAHPVHSATGRDRIATADRQQPFHAVPSCGCRPAPWCCRRAWPPCRQRDPGAGKQARHEQPAPPSWLFHRNAAATGSP